MHDTEPVRHRSPLRAAAGLLALTFALLSGVLFSTQSGALAAFDLGVGFKLPSSMQGDFTNGGARLEAGDGTGAWLGTKSQALVTLKLKAGVTANDDQPPASAGYSNGYWYVQGVQKATAVNCQVVGSAGTWCATDSKDYGGKITVTRTGGTFANAITFALRCRTAGGASNDTFPSMTGAGSVTRTCPSDQRPVLAEASAWNTFWTVGTVMASNGTPPPDAVRSGTPYARCADLSGAEISVYGTPITYRESEATGIVGTPAPSFTLPTCPASHPVRMGWGFQGPSGPLASVTAPSMPTGFSSCAGYVCDVELAPTTAAQECHQIAADNTVTSTPGGPCPPAPTGYCMFGPYSLAAAECAGAPVAEPEEVEQDPGCTPDGLANLNPFAWMGGIPCLFKYLFIPDGDAWGNAGAQIGEAWDGTAPAVVMTEGNKVFAPVVGLQDVVVGDCQGPPFTFPSLAGVTEPFTLHPLSTCNELATYLLGIYLPVATAMTYLGGFFSGTRLLLKSAGAESPVKDA